MSGYSGAYTASVAAACAHEHQNQKDREAAYEFARQSYNLGLKRYRAREYRSAIGFFNDSKSHYTPSYMLGLCYYFLGDYASTEYCLEDYVDKDSMQGFYSSLYMGYVRYHTKNYPAAMTYFVKALGHKAYCESQDTLSNLYLTLSICHYFEESYETALWAANQSIENNPTAQGYGTKSECLSLLGRAEDGLAAAERAISLDDKNAYAWQYKGSAYIRLGRLDDAKACLDYAESLGLSRTFELSYYRGMLAYAQGDWKTAQAFFKASSEEEPLFMLPVRAQDQITTEIKDLSTQATSLAESDPTKALASIETLQARVGLTADERYAKAVALKTLGRFEEAATAVVNALGLGLELRLFNLILVIVHNELKQYERSLRCATVGIENHPADGNLWFFKAAALTKLERFDEALVAFNKTVELSPDDGAVTQRDQMLQSQHGDELMAKVVVLRSSASGTTLRTAAQWIGFSKSQAASKNYENAQVAAKFAVILEPGNANAASTLRSAFSKQAAAQAVLKTEEGATLALSILADLESQSQLSPIEHCVKARSLKTLERFDEALAVLDAGIAAGGNAIMYQLKIVILCNHQKNYGAAYQVSVEGLSRYKRNPTLVLNQAICLRDLGRTDEALVVFNDAIDLVSGKYPVNQRDEMLAAHCTDGLMGKIAEIKAANPTVTFRTATDWFKYAKQQRVSRNYPLAAAAAEFVTRFDPAYSKAWTLLGEVLVHLKEYEEILKILPKAPRFISVHSLLVSLAAACRFAGEQAGRGGLFVQGVDYAERALAIRPIDSRLSSYCMNMLFGLKRYAEAAPLAEKLLSGRYVSGKERECLHASLEGMNPEKTPEKWHALGKEMLRKGHIHSVKYCFEKVVSACSNHLLFQIVLDLRPLSPIKGLESDVLKYVRLHLSRAPYSHHTQHYLASLELRNGGYSRAIKLCNQLLSNHHQEGSAWLIKAQALKAQGKFPAAISCLQASGKIPGQSNDAYFKSVGPALTNGGQVRTMAAAHACVVRSPRLLAAAVKPRPSDMASEADRVEYALIVRNSEHARGVSPVSTSKKGSCSIM